MGIKRIALFWGFAEATLFFVVPDVWLSFAGREKLATGIRACVFALGGALLGGGFMYAWGHLHPESAIQALDNIPGISQPLITQVGNELGNQGVVALLHAPTKGVPFKIYAVQAARSGLPATLFFLIAIPTRLIRFWATTLFTHYALHLLLGTKTAQTRAFVLGLGWIVFYLAYFARMGW